MKIASIEKIELLLEELERNSTELKDKKKAVISSNADEINRRIQEKINAISEQIKNEAIHEVCGEKITEIENELKINEEKTTLLNSVLFDVDQTEEQVEPTVDETVPENNNVEE